MPRTISGLPGIYNLPALTLAPGEGAAIGLTVNGYGAFAEQFIPQYENNVDGVAFVQRRPIASSTGAVSVDKSAALEASTVTKTTYGRIYGMDLRLDSTAATLVYYIQVLNASSLPADGAVTTLLAPFKIAHTNGTNDNINFDWTDVGGIYASSGIVVVLSTTEFTKTIAGAYLSGSVYYV